MIDIESYHNTMQKTLALLLQDLAGIRSGVAKPGMLEHVVIDLDGQKMRLIQLASTNIIDQMCLEVRPYDPNQLSSIYNSMQLANLGFGLTSGSTSIKVNIPRITEDSRKALVKTIKKIAEDAKVSIRNIRRDALAAIKRAGQEISEDIKHQESKTIQKYTDAIIEKIDQASNAKELELMKV